MARVCNPLWAPEVKVNRVDVCLHKLCRSNQSGRVIATPDTCEGEGRGGPANRLGAVRPNYASMLCYVVEEGRGATLHATRNYERWIHLYYRIDGPRDEL